MNTNHSNKYTLLASFLLLLTVTGCSNQATVSNPTIQAETASELTSELSTEISTEITSEFTSESVPLTDSSVASADGTTDTNSREYWTNLAWQDYTEQISSEIETILTSSTSLQAELEAIATLAESYEQLMCQDIPQAAMNMASQWPYFIWDTELNKLWSRMSDTLDADTKSSVLAEQRLWITLKDKVVREVLTDYESGSVYGLLYNCEISNITENRVYELASIYADFLGEDFIMPERDFCGLYVDNQGTDSIYSSLYITSSMHEGDYIAAISVHRLFSITGLVTETDDGLYFESDDGSNMTGTIRYNWNGASFTLSTGEIYEFPFVF